MRNNYFLLTIRDIKKNIFYLKIFLLYFILRSFYSNDILFAYVLIKNLKVYYSFWYFRFIVKSTNTSSDSS